RDHVAVAGLDLRTPRGAISPCALAGAGTLGACTRARPLERRQPATRDERTLAVQRKGRHTRQRVDQTILGRTQAGGQIVSRPGAVFIARAVRRAAWPDVV